jgi:hypothetical protein
MRKTVFWVFVGVRPRDVRHELWYEHAADDAILWTRSTLLEDPIARRASQARSMATNALEIPTGSRPW